MPVTELLVVIVIGFAVIAASTVLAPRLGVASPLVLVAIGVGVSFLPMIGAVHIEPEWILAGVLPPLLYSSAVSMPAMNFRREFGAISGLSVLLVLGTSLVLGLFFMVVLPDLGFVWGVALGAIISPTDAVATSIIKGTSVSSRVTALLEGESLLNDATALVVLRTAIVATAAAFSFWHALGTFAYSVAIAVAIGGFVGWLNLVIRKRVTDPTVNTVITFTVPFVASVPVNYLQASGLVAAVVAGLVTGYRAPRELSPQNRLSDGTNWRTIELILEGAVFLTMGIQIQTIIGGVDRGRIGTILAIAAGALGLTVAVRAAYVAPLLGAVALRSRQNAKLQPRIQDMQQKMKTSEGKQETLAKFNERARRRKRSEHDLDRFAVRLTRGLATIKYFLREPLGWREGTVVVWAGMRGAVTVAAAQTLPTGSDSPPERSALILIAFAVAAMSLLLQGVTIDPLARLVAPKRDQAEDGKHVQEERDQLFDLMKKSSEGIAEPPPIDPEHRSAEAFAANSAYRLAVLRAQRNAVLDARDDGTFDADILSSALANLDASEIDIVLRGQFAASTGMMPSSDTT